jgi:hypothetical protein
LAETAEEELSRLPCSSDELTLTSFVRAFDARPVVASANASTVAAVRVAQAKRPRRARLVPLLVAVSFIASSP